MLFLSPATDIVDDEWCAICTGAVTDDHDVRAFSYHTGDEITGLVVGWSLSGRVRTSLPGTVAEAVSRDGKPLPVQQEQEVELGPSPVYFYLS